MQMVSKIRGEIIFRIRCFVCCFSTKPFTDDDIFFYVDTDPATVINPQTEMNVTAQKNVLLTLNCVGAGYKPNISWRKNGEDIFENDTDYNTRHICNTSSCVGSIAFIPSEFVNYEGQYTCVISLESPYQSTQTSPSMNIYNLRELGAIFDLAEILHPKDNINITSQANATFRLNCLGTGFKPKMIWQRNGGDIYENDTYYIISQICNMSVCSSSITPNTSYRVRSCQDADKYNGVYTCVIKQETPQPSSAISVNMYVYLQNGFCQRHYPGAYIAGSVMVGFCLVVLAPTIVVSLYLRTKANRDTTSASQYDYIDMGDIVPNIVPSTHSSNSGHELGDIPAGQMELNDDRDLYKTMDSKGRATYIGRDEIIEMHNVRMERQTPPSYINVDEYIGMDLTSQSAYINKDNFNANDLLEIANRAHGTYIHNDILENYLERRYRSILVEKHDIL